MRRLFVLCSLVLCSCGSADSTGFDESSPSRWQGEYVMEKMLTDAGVLLVTEGRCSMRLIHQQSNSYQVKVRFDCALGSGFPMLEIKDGETFIDDQGKAFKKDETIDENNFIQFSPDFATMYITVDGKKAYIRFKKQ